MALLLIKVIVKKNGKFSSQHIHDSAAMRKMGIHCVIDQDREARQPRGMKAQRGTKHAARDGEPSEQD